MKPDTGGNPSLRFRFTLLFTLTLLPFLAGCGDGGGGTEPTPVATTVAVSPSSATLQAIGSTVQLSATVRDQNGRVMTGASVAWSCNDNGVATVSSGGLATAVSAGSATITATSGQASGTVSVSVTQVVTSVAVSPASHTMVAGEGTVQFTAAVKDANGHSVHGAGVSWTSSDPSRVSVNTSTGLATPLQPGSVTITATSGGVSGTASVTVLPRPVATVEVNPSSGSILVGETLQFTATTRDGAGNVLTGREITWSSSDLAVASVSSAGLVTALKAGTSTITATSEGHSDTANLLVRSPPRKWTVQPAGAWDTEAFVRGEDSFALLVVFCDLASDGRLLWGFNLRQLGPIPFTSGIEFPLLPQQPGDPSWSFNATASHGGALTLSVGTAGTPGTAGEMQALLRNREEAVLTYPTGNPVQAVTVRFDLRDGARAIAEAEAACAAG